MRPTIHTPERGDDESQAEYRVRRLASKAAIKRITAGTPGVSGLSKKVHRKPRGDGGQHPKFKAERRRKQHKHPLRDAHGAFTWTGCSTTHRVWLGGISAQRGY